MRPSGSRNCFIWLRSKLRQYILHWNPFAAGEKGLACLKAATIFVGYWLWADRFLIVNHNFQQLNDSGEFTWT